jgi:subtilase family serine protease
MANPGSCAQAQLRTVADSQQIVAEASEGNNSQVRSQVPPCAGLVVCIEKDDVGRLKHKAKVKVTNKGNRKTGRHFMVLVREISVPVGVIATPPTDKRIEDLGVGKSTSFSYGGEHFKTTTVGYHAIVDRFDNVKEFDENNNSVQKSLPIDIYHQLKEKSPCLSRHHPSTGPR